MHTVVDGYNVTKADPATREHSLEEQRTALVRRLRARQIDLVGPGAVTVVFDGRLGVSSPAAAGAINVRFSRDEAADELIVAIASGLEESITLCTSDGALRSRVSSVASHSVTILDKTALYEGAPSRTRTGARRKKGISRDEGLPPGGNKITEELKDLWLD